MRKPQVGIARGRDTAAFFDIRSRASGAEEEAEGDLLDAVYKVETSQFEDFRHVEC